MSVFKFSCQPHLNFYQHKNRQFLSFKELHLLVKMTSLKDSAEWKP